jgi:hypothetical protein
MRSHPDCCYQWPRRREKQPNRVPNFGELTPGPAHIPKSVPKSPAEWTGRLQTTIRRRI